MTDPREPTPANRQEGEDALDTMERMEEEEMWRVNTRLEHFYLYAPVGVVAVLFVGDVGHEHWSSAGLYLLGILLFTASVIISLRNLHAMSRMHRCRWFYAQWVRGDKDSKANAYKTMYESYRWFYLSRKLMWWRRWPLAFGFIVLFAGYCVRLYFEYLH